MILVNELSRTISLLNKSSRTAIRRNRMSAPLRVAIEMGVIDPTDKGVFDWGHGLGDDMVALWGVASRVSGWDPNHHVHGFSLEDPPTRNDLVDVDFHLCLYVLNVLPRAARVIFLGEMLDRLPPHSTALFSVRSASAVTRLAKKSNWERFSDGWITSSGTFQRGFSPESLEEILRFTGFRRVEVHYRTPLIATGVR